MISSKQGHDSLKDAPRGVTLDFVEECALQLEGSEVFSGDELGARLERGIVAEGLKRGKWIVENEARIDQAKFKQVRTNCIGPTRRRQEPWANALSKKMTCRRAGADGSSMGFARKAPHRAR